MNVGAIALISGGALLMHAALTAQSPLQDLQSIFTTGTVGGVGTGIVLPDASAVVSQTQATGGSTVFVNTPPGGPSPLGTNNLNGGGPAAASTHRWGL